MHCKWAVICLAVMLVAGCGRTASPAAETPAASSSGSPAGRSSAAPPSSPPPSAAGPASTPLTLAVPDGPLRVLPAGEPWATYGSRALETTPGVKYAGGGTLTMSDLATGRTVTLATLPGHHDLAQAVTTADRVIWVETWRDHPSPPTNAAPGCVDAGKSLRWEISALVIATGRRSVIASGTNIRTAIGGECMDVNPPVIAAEGGRIAYTLEAASPDRPVANRIVVRSLDDGHEIRSVTTNGLVQDLGLDGQTVVYRDLTAFDPMSSTVDPSDAHLLVAADDSAAPTLLDEHVNAVGLGGGRIAWSRSDAADGSVWTVKPGSTPAEHLSGLVAPDFAAEVVSQIAVSTDLVAWTVWGRYGDLNTSRLAAWRRGEPSPQFVAGFDQPDYVGISAGWLVWDATINDLEGKPAGLYGIPLAALPWPGGITRERALGLALPYSSLPDIVSASAGSFGELGGEREGVPPSRLVWAITSGQVLTPDGFPHPSSNCGPVNATATVYLDYYTGEPVLIAPIGYGLTCPN